MVESLTKKQCNEFLLSLNLIDNDMSDKKKIKLLYTLSNNIEHNYKRFLIDKRNGGKRVIYEPSYLLKKIQKNILHNVLMDFKVSKYAMAYVKGKSLKDNALPHVNKKIILKLDIKDFFNSISFMDVYNRVFLEEYFPSSIRMLLTSLCTYNEGLPQGAVTSAYISNLIMRDFDEVIGKFCDRKGISYTRYCDDMTFSGDFDVKEVIDLVKTKLKKLGLQLNYKKTHVIYGNKSQMVTGIVVNEKVQVGKRYRKKIRQEVYYIKKFGLYSHLERFSTDDFYGYLLSLIGKVNYVLMINDKDKEFLEYQKYLISVFNNLDEEI